VFLSTINTQPSTGLANFSDKEKDEASLSDGFRQDSLDAFILRFAGVKAFLFFAPRSSSFPPARRFSRTRTRTRTRTIHSALVSQPKPVP
jgi:phage-related protein